MKDTFKTLIAQLSPLENWLWLGVICLMIIFGIAGLLPSAKLAQSSLHGNNPPALTDQVDSSSNSDNNPTPVNQTDSHDSNDSHDTHDHHSICIFNFGPCG